MFFGGFVTRDLLHMRCAGEELIAMGFVTMFQPSGEQQQQNHNITPVTVIRLFSLIQRQII